MSAIGKDPNGLTQAITVEPAARFTRLRHVFVIPATAAVKEDR